MMDKRFATTEYVIEATNLEQHFLWKKHNEGNVWVPGSGGISVGVGFFHEFPVNISANWCTINDMNVLFYHATSPVVDYRMIRKWFDENCNPQYEGQRAHCDADNFHRILRASAYRMVANG